MSLEQQYYEMLVRTDHPVFKKDFNATTTADSDLNAIFNRILAKRLVEMRTDLNSFIANAFPQTVDANGIDLWEETYFGFNKPSEALAQRVTELMQRRNSRITMSAPDVVSIAESITGLTPIVIRNLFFGGWVLDVGVLDVSTIFAGDTQSTDSQTYVVIFSESVSSALLKQLDDALTAIEKGGSTHVIIAPSQYWVLDVGAMDVDSLLG